MTLVEGAVVKHPFTHEVIDRIGVTIAAGARRVVAASGHEDEARRANNKNATVGERYDIAVLNALQGLVAAMAMARNAHYFATTAPSSVGLRRTGITRDAWIDYHFGVFTVSLASIPDTCLMLVGATNRLGLSRRHHTADIIDNHERVKGSELVPSLRAIRKAVESSVSRRHAHVHRGEHADFGDIVGRDAVLSLRMIELSTSLGAEHLPASDVRGAWKALIEQLSPALLVLLQSVEQSTSGLLDILHVTWRRTSDALRAR
jgi:hypothetical protein